MPWTAEEYVALYKHIEELIEEIDPAVIAVDTFLGPAMSVTRELNRRHVTLSPNTLKDQFAFMQSWGTGVWKFPA